MPGKKGFCISTSLNCCGASPPTPTEIQVLLRGTCFSWPICATGAVVAWGAGAVVGAADCAGGAVLAGAALLGAVVAAGPGAGFVAAEAGAAVGPAGADEAHAANRVAAPKMPTDDRMRRREIR